MAVTYPTTDTTTPEKLAILPDWGEGLKQRTTYRTELSTSRRGLEQRTQHRVRPMLVIDYRAQGIHDADARKRLEAAVANFRKPLLVPWWPQGTVLQSTSTDTGALLSTNPVADDWDRDGFIYLWNRSIGGEFRILASRTGRTLTLTDEGGHLAFPAGSFAFPVRLAVRERDDALLNPGALRTNPERLIFRTL